MRMTRGGVLSTALLAAIWLAGCMVTTYEEVPSDRRKLNSGLEVLLVWPEAAAPSEPGALFVEYISFASNPALLAVEAQQVWAEIRYDAEQRSVVRVAILPTVVERGFKWQSGRPSFWRSTTTTFWHGRGKDGQWTEGDPGVSRAEQ